MNCFYYNTALPAEACENHFKTYRSILWRIFERDLVGVLPLEPLYERGDAVREAEGQVLLEVCAQVVAVEPVQHLEGLLVWDDVARGCRALVYREDVVHAVWNAELLVYLEIVNSQYNLVPLLGI